MRTSPTLGGEPDALPRNTWRHSNGLVVVADGDNYDSGSSNSIAAARQQEGLQHDPLKIEGYVDDLWTKDDVEGFEDEFSSRAYDQEAEAEVVSPQQQKQKSRVGTYILVIGLILCLGAIVGIGGGKDGGTGNSADEGSVCASANDEATQPESYHEMRSIIVSKYPTLDASISARNSNARKALCWLVHDDGSTVRVGISSSDEQNKASHRAMQRFALAVVYYYFTTAAVNTNFDIGFTESNWLSPTLPECEWAFVACDDVTVTGIQMNSMGLKGRIPSELALLEKLVTLEVSENYLTGQIPTQLWTLTELKTLNLHGNELTGTFPIELTTSLRGLESLDLGGNGFTGMLPNDMGALSNMVSLSLENLPQVTGPFPAISGWTNLEKLHLLNVGITGTLPSYITELTKLEELKIFTTPLKGTIPTRLGTLLKLSKLDLSESRFSGNIPSELGNLTNLRSLKFLSSFNLTGTMPSEICNLRSDLLVTLTAECREVSCDCCTRCQL